MSLVIKTFTNDVLDLSMDTYIDKTQNIYFKGKDVAVALGYENTGKAIRDHVDDEYKIEYRQLSGGPIRSPEKYIQGQTIFISEPGLYSLIFGSKLDTAKVFQRWVFSKVLPSIRKDGYYKLFDTPNHLVYKMQDEFDLHRKVVEYIRRFYPDTIMTAGLGENQDTSEKRIASYQKGYQKGQPDLTLNNLHKHYNGFCIEFKTPQGTGILSEAQRLSLDRYKQNGYKILISNDYDIIIKHINDYLQNSRIKCEYCYKKVKTNHRCSRMNPPVE